MFSFSFVFRSFFGGGGSLFLSQSAVLCSAPMPQAAASSPAAVLELPTTEECGGRAGGPRAGRTFVCRGGAQRVPPGWNAAILAPSLGFQVALSPCTCTPYLLSGFACSVYSPARECWLTPRHCAVVFSCAIFCAVSAPGMLCSGGRWLGERLTFGTTEARPCAG